MEKNELGFFAKAAQEMGLDNEQKKELQNLFKVRDDGLLEKKAIVEKMYSGDVSLDGAIFYTLMLILEELEKINNNKIGEKENDR